MLYTECDGVALRGPNDIVFDRHGGFYFTDLGKVRERDMDRGAIFYALPDGTAIRQVAHPVMTPNGIGLSPDETTLYVAETETCRLWSWSILQPGVVQKQPWPSPHGGQFVKGFSSYQRFDSLAVEANGNVCVATLLNGGVTIISPDGADAEHVAFPDLYCTNICFGGDDIQTAYMTLSGAGQLIKAKWPRPGLALNF